MKTQFCGGCGAKLDVSAFDPGTEFACGGCGATLLVAGTSPGPAPAAPAAPARGTRPAPARPGRRREETAGASQGRRAKSNAPLLAVAVGAGVLLLGGGAWFALRPRAKPPEPPPPPVALKPKAAPEKVLPPDEAEWAKAATDAEKEAVARRRTDESKVSDAASKELFRFLVSKGRADLARKAARARLDADPENAWAGDALGLVNAKAAFEELRPRAADLDDAPADGWDRIKKRMEGGKTWVDAEERKQYEADLASVRRQVETLSDPWHMEALRVAREVRSDPAFKDFGPIDIRLLPPYLVMAEHQKDANSQSTKNVLDNHSKFFKCLTGEFLKVMAEAGLPTPTVKEMGDPVLKAFIFTSRNEFDRWHSIQGIKVPAGWRAYYSGGSQFMMTYDTGASSELQSPDTCTAFHEATHQLVHYYRRYYLTQELRKKDPSAPDVDFLDNRVHGRTHWFQEGFAEFFGAADRISAQTGEWKLLRPYRSRLAEWGNPVTRKEPQWTLEEVVNMVNSMQLGMLSKKKNPESPDGMGSLYYAEAWALNHFLYFGLDGKYRAKYLKVVHEEMLCHSGSEVFYEVMGAGEGAARKKFMEDLEYEIYDYVKGLLRGK